MQQQQLACFTYYYRIIDRTNYYLINKNTSSYQVFNFMF